MNERELIHTLRTSPTGVTPVSGEWTVAQVEGLWRDEVNHYDRKRLSIGYKIKNGKVAGIVLTPRRQSRAAPPSAVAVAMWAVVATAAIAAFVAPPAVPPADQCWQWDQGNYTLSASNTLDQFEKAHEFYRKTGRAPDRLSECPR